VSDAHGGQGAVDRFGAQLVDRRARELKATVLQTTERDHRLLECGLVAAGRHVEMMRDDLSEVYYDAGRDDTEYLFGDSITAICPDSEVTFEHAAARRFDVIVGADGLHSKLRRVTTPPRAEQSSDVWQHGHLAGEITPAGKGAIRVELS
jgi:2-polyprenyl-6-methoxyphenol hydroxylase-like FAD-dependent oxidoreductase